MQKQKEQEANNMIMKVGAKVVRKEVMKKRNTVIEIFQILTMKFHCHLQKNFIL